MQTQDMTALMADAFKGWDKLKKGLPEDEKLVKNKMASIEESNNLHLKEHKTLPDYLRTPTAEELLQMRNFAIEYKRANKNASKREVRRATQKMFNVRIFR